jgi:hypothetical protein
MIMWWILPLDFGIGNNVYKNAYNSIAHVVQ